MRIQMGKNIMPTDSSILGYFSSFFSCPTIGCTNLNVLYRLMSPELYLYSWTWYVWFAHTLESNDRRGKCRRWGGERTCRTVCQCVGGNCFGWDFIFGTKNWDAGKRPNAASFTNDSKSRSHIAISYSFFDITDARWRRFHLSMRTKKPDALTRSHSVSPHFSIFELFSSKLETVEQHTYCVQIEPLHLQCTQLILTHNRFFFFF